MNYAIYILYQFLPVAIGIALLFLIKSLKLINSKIQIATPQTEELVESYDLKESRQYHKTELETTVRELLIINGRLPKNRNVNLCDYAVHNAGIACYSNLSRVPGSLNRSKPQKLTIITSNPKLLSRSLTRPNPISGLLLAYSIEEKLEIVNQCT